MRASIPALTLAAVAAVGVSEAAAQDLGRFRDAVVVCESHDGRTQQCAADTWRNEVRLLRQLSRSECIENRTWGVTRGGIWVGKGCRGEFLVIERHRAKPSPVVSDFIRCESNNGRSNRCPANTRRGVELVRQLSRSPCIRGQSWGWDERVIWVSGGCRAEFRVTAHRRDDAPTPPAATRCESIDGALRHCPADTRGGVRLVRQRSRSECVEGRTWGYDREGIWVEDGCRADFELGVDRPGWAGRGR